jgi:hypothetical protein
LPQGLTDAFLPATLQPAAGEHLLYRPMLGARVSLHYVQARAGIDVWQQVALLAELHEAEAAWDEAVDLGRALPELHDAPVVNSLFGDLDALPKARRPVQDSLVGHLYRGRPLATWSCKKPKATSTPDETEGAFRARVRELLREERDRQMQTLRDRYAPKLARLQDQIARAEQNVEVQESQYQEKKLQTAVSIGTTLLGALFGRKLISSGTVSKASTAARRAGSTARELGDIGRAEEKVEALQQRLAALEAELAEDLDALEQPIDPQQLDIAEGSVPPRKADIAVEELLVVWAPWVVRDGELSEAAYAC